MRTEDTEKLIRDMYASANLREVAFLSLASQGGITAAEILARALAKEGKEVYVGVYLRGERTNTPVLNSIRIADRGPIPTCAVFWPTELMVFDEALYNVTEDQTRQALIGTARGTLMVCTDEEPKSIDFPYDFEGRVATSDARRICRDVVGRNPPPFGTTALGLYAAATKAVSLESLQEATRERLPGEIGIRNAQAVAIAFKGTKVLEDVRIAGKHPRPREVYVPIPFDEVPEFGRQSRPPLPGISRGNPYLWREVLPVWEEKKCTCGGYCVLVDFCPESVISYKFTPISKEYHVDYEYCKGCGICAVECPHSAITMKSARDVYGR